MICFNILCDQECGGRILKFNFMGEQQICVEQTLPLRFCPMGQSQLHRSPGIVADFVGEDPDGVIQCHFVVPYLEVVRYPLDQKGEDQV